MDRPEAKYIRSFKIAHVGAHTVGDYLDRGYGLLICCKECERTVSWSPQDLADKFGDKRGLRLADLVPRLSCAGSDGCGSRDVAVFPDATGGEEKAPRLDL
jgi:hypothetical protein